MDANKILISVRSVSRKYFKLHGFIIKCQPLWKWVYCNVIFYFFKVLFYSNWILKSKQFICRVKSKFIYIQHQGGFAYLIILQRNLLVIFDQVRDNCKLRVASDVWIVFEPCFDPLHIRSHKTFDNIVRSQTWIIGLERRSTYRFSLICPFFDDFIIS